MSLIKNIIFDLGGVLLNVDYAEPVRNFQRLGLRIDENWYAQQGQHDLFDKLETGKISPAAFRNTIRKFVGGNIRDNEIDHAWNSVLKDFPKERMDLLLRLKQNYRLFLLSNTNAIHIPAFYKILEATFGRNFFPEVFEKTYYSHEIGLRKPHRETFQFVLNDAKLNPAETFFIDDSKQHIKGALDCGIQAEWLELEKEDVLLFAVRKNWI